LQGLWLFFPRRKIKRQRTPPPKKKNKKKSRSTKKQRASKIKRRIRIRRNGFFNERTEAYRHGLLTAIHITSQLLDFALTINQLIFQKALQLPET
jgi:neutral trehalase